MKKFLFIIFALALCLFTISIEKPEVSANTENKGELISSEIEYLEDGSYLIKEYYTNNEAMNTRSNVRSVLHTITVTQYSATDQVLWIYELVGGWYVEDGVSVVANSSVFHITINNNSWSFHDGEATYAGTIVHGGGNFKFKVLGVTIKTVYIDLNIECDIYGNFIEK